MGPKLAFIWGEKIQLTPCLAVAITDWDYILILSIYLGVRVRIEKKSNTCVFWLRITFQIGTASWILEWPLTVDMTPKRHFLKILPLKNTHILY